MLIVNVEKILNILAIPGKDRDSKDDIIDAVISLLSGKLFNNFLVYQTGL